jgi:hypothetical protein
MCALPKGNSAGKPPSDGRRELSDFWIYCSTKHIGYAAVDRIIAHLKLIFVVEKPPPTRVLTEVALMAAEERAEYC